MMIKSFLLKLNARQLIIFFIATWLFIYATHTLTSLYDYSFLYKEFALQNRSIFRQRFDTDMFIIHTGGYLGLIAAYVISWQISEKRNWFWANAVIVFLISFGLYFFDLLGWKTLKNVFLSPGHVFSDINSVASVITSGLVMLLLGCLLFFNKKILRYIDGGVKKEKATGSLKMANVATARKK